MAGFRQRGSQAVELAPVPYPAVTVVIELSEDRLVLADRAGGEQRGGVAGGLGPRGLRAGGHAIECLQVRLSPVVAHAVLDPALLGGGAVAGLHHLWGRSAERLEARLRSAGTWDERFALVEAELGRRWESGPAVDPEVVEAWEGVVASHGRVRVETLARRTGWSRKRLWRRFVSQVGTTPKQAARLVRFDHAAHRLAAGSPAAQVAADLGYFDQSHLHRDVAAFADLTPAGLAIAPWLAVDDVAWTRNIRQTQRAHGP